jgi:hypothetical protein
MLQIILNNWNAAKVSMLIGEQPSPFFESRVFSEFHTAVEEGVLTPTQRNLHAQQLMDINQIFGREVFPPSMIIKDMNLSGKAEAMQYLQQQEQQMQAVNAEAQNIEHTFNEAKIKEMYARTAAAIATARERHGRAESNIGLLEERLSEISKNQSLSIKSKMEALAQLVEVVGKYGEIETNLKMNEIQSLNFEEEMRENQERQQAKQSSESNKFMQELMGGMMQQQSLQGDQQMQGQEEPQAMNQ